MCCWHSFEGRREGRRKKGREGERKERKEKGRRERRKKGKKKEGGKEEGRRERRRKDEGKSSSPRFGGWEGGYHWGGRGVPSVPGPGTYICMYMYCYVFIYLETKRWTLHRKTKILVTSTLKQAEQKDKYYTLSKLTPPCQSSNIHGCQQ